MKTVLMALICLVLAGAGSSEAKPNKKAAHASARKSEAQVAGWTGFALGGGHLVAVARSYIGQNPTEMSRVWCGRFMRLVLQRAGFGDPGRDFDAARSFAKLGRPGPPGEGAIVWWGNHVGVIARVTGPGRAIVISGNDGPKGHRTVLERERSIAGAGFRYL